MCLGDFPTTTQRKISVMMTYHTFLANIFSLCKFIGSDLPSRVWVDGEAGVTSVVSPEEFFEQAFGDNDLENMILRFSTELKAEHAYPAITAYRDSLLKLEALFDAKQGIEPRKFLASEEWLNLCSAVGQVMALPAARTAFQQGYGR